MTNKMTEKINKQFNVDLMMEKHKNCYKNGGLYEK